MKFSPRQIGLVILLFCGALSACSGTPIADEPLPTLAQLPTITPIVNPVTTVTAVPNTSITPQNTAAPAMPTDITPNPIVLPGSLSPTETATSVNDLGLDTFPEILEVGTQVTLKGILTSTDSSSGFAILTNENGQTVNLIVDPFTAMTANNQAVQITGTVEKQTGNPANAVHVSEISMVNGASALATATDMPIPGVPTTTP